MNKNEHARWAPLSAVAALVIALGTGGCGDGGNRDSKAAAPPLTPSDHEIFEQKYTEQCIKTQRDAAAGQPVNDQEVTKLCDCIAQTISKRLSKADAIHFNKKNEFPFDLVMMTQSAENTCTSAKN